MDSEYALIIDESFNIGGQSMLLVLAVNLTTYQFGEALWFSDCQAVSIQVKRSWKGKDISEVVQEVIQQNYQIAYVIADGGNNITRALKDSGLGKIYDCTLLLENSKKNKIAIRAK